MNSFPIPLRNEFKKKKSGKSRTLRRRRSLFQCGPDCRFLPVPGKFRGSRLDAPPRIDCQVTSAGVTVRAVQQLAPPPCLHRLSPAQPEASATRSVTLPASLRRRAARGGATRAHAIVNGRILLHNIARDRAPVGPVRATGRILESPRGCPTPPGTGTGASVTNA